MSRVQIGLTNPKSPSNVGSVMRAAGCYDVDEVLYTGSRYDRAAKFQTDTKKVANKIPLKHTDCLVESRSETTKIVCVELVEGAIPLPDFKHPEDAIYIFGPEDGSLEQSVVSQADEVVYIPTIGCMNLAATVNVILYDRLAKNADWHSGEGTGDSLIRASRDRNNQLQV